MTDIMLAEAPAHWRAERLGQFFEERKEKVSDKEYAPLSVTKNGIVPQLDTAAKTNDGDNRKRVCAGDFVINSRSDRKGSSGLSMLDGSVSLISIVLKPRRIDPRFAHHLLRSGAFQEEFYRWGHGIVADLWTTRFFDMKNIQVALPDLDTQRAIADVLDRETARIDGLIDKKEQLIRLLIERKEAVITEAITTGIDPSVPVKPSKTNYLKDVPSHWIVERLRFSIRKVEQGWSPPSEQRRTNDGEWGILKVGCVNFGRFRPEEHKALPIDVLPRPEWEVKPQDLLMSRGNSLELVGSAAVVTEWRPRLMMSDLLYRLVLDGTRATPQFVAFALNSRPLRRQIELCASGSSDTMPKISQDKIKNLVWARPPVQEQVSLTDYLLAVASRSETLIRKCQRSIDSLLEFRSTLVTAAVTGKIDVATWSKKRTVEHRLDAVKAEEHA
jgi:type I restriction enzyme S subunit